MNSERTEQLTALLDGRLNAEQAAELRAKMLREPELAELFEQLNAQSQMLKTLPRWNAPSGFAKTILDSVATLDPNQTNIERESPRGLVESNSRIGFGWKRWIALAASISGVGLLLAFFLTDWTAWNEIAKQESATPTAGKSVDLKAPNLLPKSQAGPDSAVSPEGRGAADPSGRMVNADAPVDNERLEDEGAPPQNSGLALGNKSLNKNRTEIQDSPDNAPPPTIAASPPGQAGELNPTSPEMKKLLPGSETNRSVAESELGLIPEKGNSKPEMKLDDRQMGDAKKLETAGDVLGFGGGGGGGLRDGMPGLPADAVPPSGNPADQLTGRERVAGETSKDLPEFSDDAQSIVAGNVAAEVWILDLPPNANLEGGDKPNNVDKNLAKEALVQLDCYLVTLASGEPPNELLKLQQSAGVQKLTFADGFPQSQFPDAPQADTGDSTGRYKKSDEEAVPRAESFSRGSSGASDVEPVVQRFSLDQTVLERAFREASQLELPKQAEDRNDRGHRTQLPIPDVAASHNDDVQAGLEYLRRLSAQSEDLPARLKTGEKVAQKDLAGKSLSQKSRELPAAGAGGLDGGNVAPQEPTQDKEQGQLAGASSRRILILFRSPVAPVAPPSPIDK